MVSGEGFDWEALAHSVCIGGSLHPFLVSTLLIGHPSIDPKAAIDRVPVIDECELLAILLVSFLRSIVSEVQGPIKCLLIDLSASISDFIIVMEVCISLA